MEMNKRNFKGVWIPKEIWLDKNLNIQEKCFLAEINSLDDEVKGCFALNEHFSNLFNLSKNRCSEVIKSLQEKGFISVDYEYKNKQIIGRTIKIINKFYPFGKSTPPFDISNTPSENLVDRITLENNILDSNTLSHDISYKKKKFIPPTLEDVQQYINERNNGLDAKSFYDYYAVNDWHDGNGKPVKSWKQKLLTWEKHNKEKANSQNIQTLPSAEHINNWYNPEMEAYWKEHENDY